MATDLELASPSLPVYLQPAAFYCAGFSCALAALGAQGRLAGGCDPGVGRRGCRWSRATELALREKAGELERKVEEFRRRRAEDARANEKVADIFASHEQRWLAERKALRRQVDAVVAAARAREAKREEEAEGLRRAAGDKDEALAREVGRREGAEERLREAERAGKDAAEHAAELRKHKAAFLKLESAQRQLEADLVRAARRADTAEAELRAALERSDDLSAEGARLRRDADHKDKILSAMLRKSKIDMEDREMLVREVNMCNARRKQAELEAERWRKMWESRGNRRGSRSSAQAADHPGCSDKLALDAVVRANDTKILLVDHVERDCKKVPPEKELTTVECVNRYPSHMEDKPAVEEYQGLQEWVQMETEKYAAMIKHRHNAEIEAFTEQLRIKDEKLEAFRWRSVSMEFEATRLRCRVQELEARLAQQGQHSAGLEALLLVSENQNRALEEQLEELQAQDKVKDEYTVDRCVPCSPVEMEGTEKAEAERLSPSGARHQDGTEVANSHNAEIKTEDPVSPDVQDVDGAFHAEATARCGGVLVTVPDHAQVDAAASTEPDPYDVPARHSFRCEIEEKEVHTDPGNAHSQTSTGSSQATMSDLALVVVALPEQKASACKTDIHALAVSYKIKRLKQQLALLEKVAAAEGKEEEATVAKPADSEASSSSSRQQPRSRYQTMISFLSKHVKRYQSLDDKIDDLRARMEEGKRSGGGERRGGAGEQQCAAAALGQFLEETFQLQRLVVATGQKLLETQSRITPGLARPRHGVDMKRLMDVVGALLRDVQRGLEVRIARIIGDLEGTLTFHGILHTKR